MSEAAPAVVGDTLGLGSVKLDELDDAAARFLQYMEGREDGLSVAYSRVLGATSHTGLIELQRGGVGNRRLPFRPMRRFPTQPAALRRLDCADWLGSVQHSDGQAEAETAMAILPRLVEPYAIAA